MDVAGICIREYKHLTASEQVTLSRPLAVQESSVAGQWPCSQLLSLYRCRDGISCSIHMQSVAHWSATLHISSSHLRLQKWLVDNIHHKVCNSCCRQSRQTNPHSSVTRPLMRIYFLTSWWWPQCRAPRYSISPVISHPGSYPDPENLVWISISYRLVLAFRDQISQTRSVKFTFILLFALNISWISHEAFCVCFELGSPSILRSTLSSELQSCVSVSDLPDSWIMRRCKLLHGHQPRAPGIMYGQHSADFLSLPPLCAGPGMTPDNQERAVTGLCLCPLTELRAVHWP